jgi:hypothetical protein
VEACLSPFGDSANLDEDTCAVCVECTIGSKIILDAPDGNPMSVGNVESHFGLFGDSVTVNVIKEQGLR